MDDENIMEFNFDHEEDAEHHICETFRDGDWIIFRCSKCPDYERRLNWRTQEMKVQNSNTISHIGKYFPEEYREAFENVN